MRSLSLSNFFDSDNERLNPIFSLSKKFDSDNEFLIYMTNVIKYICLFYTTPVCMYVRGVLGNKCAGQHNLKTLHFKETIVSANF